MIVIVAAMVGIVAAMALMLSRLFLGPTLYDRVLAVNAFGTKTVLFLVLFAFLIGRGDAIDIAILYALINFVATIAVLKFFRFRAFDLALARMAGASGARSEPETPPAAASAYAPSAPTHAAPSEPAPAPYQPPRDPNAEDER